MKKIEQKLFISIDNTNSFLLNILFEDEELPKNYLISMDRVEILFNVDELENTLNYLDENFNLEIDFSVYKENQEQLISFITRLEYNNNLIKNLDEKLQNEIKQMLFELEKSLIKI